MKASVKFWKNFDCTFGACISITVDGNTKNDFPTNSVFDSFGSLVSASFKEDSNTVNFTQTDNQSLYGVHTWVNDTIVELQKFTSDYYACIVPSDFDVEL